MTEETHTVQNFFLIFSILLMVILFLTKFLHSRPRLHSVLSEPAMTLLVGMGMSLVVSVFFVEEEDALDFNGNANVEEDVDLANAILAFQTKVFFMALLPPILFNSGYQLQRELFYRHFTPISLFACLGTCISAFACGGFLVYLKHLGFFGDDFDPSTLELLTFGSLIAATDTVSVVGVLQAKKVDPHLFSLVFGESALNDAVAIVLYNSLRNFLVDDAFGDASSLWEACAKFLIHLAIQAICSPIIGTVFALCMGLAFRFVDLRELPHIELALYILPMYMPFIFSETLELSGMIAIFFTGICAKRYMEPNVSLATQQHAQTLFGLAAFLAETCIFLELGLSVFGLSGSFQWRFIIGSLAAALLGRAVSIYPLAAIYNLSLTKLVRVLTCQDDRSTDSSNDSSVDQPSVDHPSVDTVTTKEVWATRRETPERKRDKKIPIKFMHMLWFAGLRGAVAYACAREFPNWNGHRDEIVAATMVIVFITIVVMGGGTKYVLSYLEIRTNVDEEEYMRHWRSQRKLKGLFHRFEYNYIYRLVRKQEAIPETDGVYNPPVSEAVPQLSKTGNASGAFDYRGFAGVSSTIP